ncbi:MAG: AAA family ATPase [Burkholderiaceae bacterium]
MKIRRLRIESFKRFREPLDLDGFADGLNLFAAPNEAGKSTVAEAIRAAFFERHRSGAVEHLRPWDQGSATPTVLIEFALQGRPARLTKAFLGKKRCELVIDDEVMDGAAAEDHLASLLGFRFAGKGASTPEHMGLPGLLWIRQGDSHELAGAVRHAENHLRQALGESLGELASGDGDAVLDAVRAQRHELLTPGDGRPRGDYKAAIERRQALSGELAELDAAIAHYRQDVDRLDALRRAHQRDEAEPPWRALRAALDAARQRLEAVQTLVAERERQHQTLSQVDARVALLREQVQGFARDEQAAAERRRAFDDALQARESAHQAVAACEPTHRRAQDDERRARETLQAARQALAVAEQREQLDALREQHEALSATLRMATDAHRQLDERQRDAEQLRVDDATLQRLRALDRRRHAVQVELDTVATRLCFALLPGASLTIDGEAIAGPPADVERASRAPAPTSPPSSPSPSLSPSPPPPSSPSSPPLSRTITRRAELTLPGLGALTIEPGGKDLDTLARERDELDAGLVQGLRQAGVADLAALDARAQQYRARQADAEASRKLLATLAPQGLDELSQRCHALRGQIDRLARALASALTAPADQVPPDVRTAEASERDARRALDAAQAALDRARQAAAGADAELGAARREQAAAQALLDDPQRRARGDEAQRQLVDALSVQSVARRELEALDQRLRDANPALLEQDVQRLSASVTQAEAVHRRRGEQLARLEIELETKGARGLEEAAAEKRLDLAQAERRHEQLRRRAEALDLLYRLLNERRDALAQRLRAPLSRHVDHYLQILFPGARLRIGEDLAPGPITRDGPAGPETGTFETLSLGTREQMGVIARLAYADLLREAGRPTLLILDDALVHSDEDRLAQMKRVLYDAASRHQILIFTCHPAAWRDLGVAARPLQP